MPAQEMAEKALLQVPAVSRQAPAAQQVARLRPAPVGLVPVASARANKYPNSTSGLISATADGIISGFYGYGQNNCSGGLVSPVPPADFTAGLLDFRDQMQGFDNFGTYYIDSTTHTWIGGAGFYTTTVGGVLLVDWFRDIVEGTAAANVGP